MSAGKVHEIGVHEKERNTYSYFDVVEAANSLASYAEDALETLLSGAQLMMQHAQV